MSKIREQCPYCLSMNYIDDNSENLGFEAYECWNCMERSFLPDQGLFRFMDRKSVEEDEAMQSLKTYEPLIVNGDSCK